MDRELLSQIADHSVELPSDDIAERVIVTPGLPGFGGFSIPACTLSKKVPDVLSESHINFHECIVDTRDIDQILGQQSFLQLLITGIAVEEPHT